MFDDPYFYHQLIHKYIRLFGVIFSNMIVEREDKDGNVVDQIRVPISYAAKQKVLTRFDADPKIRRLAAVVLPRMSFELADIQYDVSRKSAPLNKITVPNADPSKGSYVYSGTPYNFMFNLYIYAKNAEDATKLVEQILPYFNPEWTVSAKLIEGMTPVDIPIILNKPSMIDTYEGRFEVRQAIIWTLTFTVKGILYGPTRTKPLIKFIDGILRNCPNPLDPVATITIQPGLTANGEPTIVEANSIPVADIKADDPYGLVITRTGVEISA